MRALLSLRISIFIASNAVIANAFVSHYPFNPKQVGKCLRNTALLPVFATVQVFNNVFSEDVCCKLHDLAIDHNTRARDCDGSSIFTRPPHNERPLTPLEHAMDSVLTELGDETQKVEYWSREEYMNIDIHADIDEVQLEEDYENGVSKEHRSSIRCPQMGHVLYLEVRKGLKGPTCVFPEKQIGWGLTTKEEQSEDNTNNVDLVIVPAVQGRILRFPGSAMHAVPKPVDRWLLSKEEEALLRKNEEDEEDDYDDIDDDEYIFLDDDEEWIDDEDDDAEVERSVLLFNTWPDDEPGPQGVNGDYITGALPEGIEIDESDIREMESSMEAQRLKEWEEEYGVNAARIRCNPSLQWEVENYTRNIDHDSDWKQTGVVRASLMGTKERRLHPEKFVNLKSQSIPLIQESLSADTHVSMIHLTEDFSTL